MRNRLAALAVAVAILLIGYHFADGAETLTSWRFSQELTLGKQIAPVPLDLKDKTPDIVYLGSYVVNSLGCNDCHTCPSYRGGPNPYQVGGNGLGRLDTPGPVNRSNYLAGGTPFGTLKSGNLTPDATGLPGGFTYDQFLEVMQNGTHPRQPGRILQVMPWPRYRSLSLGDLSAVYEYLKSLPPAEPGTCGGPNEAN
jgi:hypothetical protein